MVPGSTLDIGIQLLHRDLQATGAEKSTEAAGRQTLTEGGGNTPGDEDVPGRGFRPPGESMRALCHGVPTYPTFALSPRAAQGESEHVGRVGHPRTPPRAAVHARPGARRSTPHGPARAGRRRRPGPRRARPLRPRRPRSGRRHRRSPARHRPPSGPPAHRRRRNRRGPRSTVGPPRERRPAGRPTERDDGHGSADEHPQAAGRAVPRASRHRRPTGCRARQTRPPPPAMTPQPIKLAIHGSPPAFQGVQRARGMEERREAEQAREPST